MEEDEDATEHAVSQIKDMVVACGQADTRNGGDFGTPSETDDRAAARAAAHAETVRELVSTIERLAAESDGGIAEPYACELLCYSCWYGNDAATRALLRADVNPEGSSPTAVPLLYASERGHAACVRELLGAGAIADTPGNEGVTALMRACQAKHAECAKLLLDANANPNAAALADGPMGKIGNAETPLLMASFVGSVECVKLLLTARALVDPPMGLGDGAFNIYHCSCRATFTHWGPCRRHLQSSGHSIGPRAEDRCTPLRAASTFGHAAIVQLLLEAGADVNRCAWNSWHGETALLAACDRDHPQCVRMLVEAKAAVDLPSRRGETPLMAACVHGAIGCARALLEAGASVDCQDDHGASALMYACVHDRPMCVELLLSEGADPLDKGVAGLTPLKATSIEGHLRCSKLLDLHLARLANGGAESPAVGSSEAEGAAAAAGHTSGAPIGTGTGTGAGGTDTGTGGADAIHDSPPKSPKPKLSPRYPGGRPTVWGRGILSAMSPPPPAPTAKGRREGEGGEEEGASMQMLDAVRACRDRSKEREEKWPPVDVVVSWVDSTDLQWQASYREVTGQQFVGGARWTPN
jgi:ankyrin repeat protein